MKTFLQLTCILLVTVMAGCSKNRDKKGNNFADNFKGQTWTGQVKYKTSMVKDPFSVTFQSDNTFIWTDRFGKIPSTYSLNETDRKITLNFPIGQFVTFTIQGDSSFVSPQYSTGLQWTLTSGEKNNSVNESIINTKWKSTTTASHSLEFTSSIEAKGLGGTWGYTKEGPFIRGTDPGISGEFYFVINKNKLTGFAGMLGLSYVGEMVLVKQ